MSAISAFSFLLNKYGTWFIIFSAHHLGLFSLGYPKENLPQTLLSLC